MKDQILKIKKIALTAVKKILLTYLEIHQDFKLKMINKSHLSMLVLTLQFERTT